MQYTALCKVLTGSALAVRLHTEAQPPSDRCPSRPSHFALSRRRRPPGGRPLPAAQQRQRHGQRGGGVQVHGCAWGACLRCAAPLRGGTLPMPAFSLPPPPPPALLRRCTCPCFPQQYPASFMSGTAATWQVPRGRLAHPGGAQRGRREPPGGAPGRAAGHAAGRAVACNAAVVLPFACLPGCCVGLSGAAPASTARLALTSTPSRRCTLLPSSPLACSGERPPPAAPGQVWVYEEADERGPANLFVHHSLMLPAFPLAVAWLDCDPTGKVRLGPLPFDGVLMLAAVWGACWEGRAP